jgi:hypothetical protein
LTATLAADTLRDAAEHKNIKIGSSMNYNELRENKGVNNYSSVAGKEF